MTKYTKKLYQRFEMLLFSNFAQMVVLLGVFFQTIGTVFKVRFFYILTTEAESNTTTVNVVQNYFL